RLDRIDQEMDQAKQDQWIQIASVQPNIPFNKHDLPPKERGNNLQSTIDLTQKVMHDNPETNLVVWPELPLIMVCQDESTQDIENLVKAINCPLIYNCSRRAGEDQYYNAAVFLSPAGESNFEYHKRLLFPFGEYLPFRRFFSYLGLTTPDFLKTAHGKTPSVFDMGLNQKIIPSLCYESVFS
ncbi:MAG: hypothetical protein GY702_26885, partial [Desulfobulbaceae bacterium]|nr:hypothetical protein [Desulfobulbaceae bacterium]